MTAAPPARWDDHQGWTEFLAGFGQQHLLGFWDQLSQAGRQQLATQLAGIDWNQLAWLLRQSQQHHDWAAAARRAQPPVAVRLTERFGQISGQAGKDPSAREREAIERGRAALAGGNVGVLITAGGQGTRLGFDQPKGLYPIGPVSGASLLEIHLRKALALAAGCGQSVPVYLMTSPATDQEQRDFLRDNDHFGLPEKDLFVFCQGTMPAVDAQSGQLLLGEMDSLFLSPDGHGGTIHALEKSGALAHMEQRGIEVLFYLQVDNPLVPIGDAAMIGYHYAAGSELTSMAVAKQEPADKVGNFVTVDGNLQVIEYSDFPADVAELRQADGGLRFWAGSIAVHVFSVSFLRRSLTVKESLPFHIAHKKVPYIAADGSRVEPDQPNALKFERFIFDLLPHAGNPLVVEFPEKDVFAPLKNAPGAPKDTAKYVQDLMIRQYVGWLREAGVQVAAGVAVEIDPLWALDAAAVARRVEAGMSIDENIYLQD